MSEKRKNNPNQNPNYTRRRVGALVVAATAALGLVKGVEALNSHPQSSSDKVKEYIVKPGDTAWTVANRAFRDEADNAEKMYDVRQEITDQLPQDDAHENGMLQPGDRLIFDDNADIGNEMNVKEETKELEAASPVKFYNSSLGKDGKVHSFGVKE
jgi:hypothetical protein